MSNTFNEQVWRAQVDYQRELGRGRLSSWARTEGRCGRLVRRVRGRARRDDNES